MTLLNVCHPISLHIESDGQRNRMTSMQPSSYFPPPRGKKWNSTNKLPKKQTHQSLFFLKKGAIDTNTAYNI